jgi:uncharacterized membrane protein
VKSNLHTMKKTLLVCGLVATLFLPVAVRAQEGPRPEPRPAPDRPNWEPLRDELRNLPPEERQARLRELRERFGQGTGAPQPGLMASRASGAIERVFMVLTPEQRESLRKAGEENRDKVRELEEKLRDARKEIMAASLGKDFNERGLRERLEAAARLEIDLTVLRARTLAKVEPPLSAEQIERIKNPALGGQRFGAPPEGAVRRRPQPRPPEGARDENDLPPRAQP